MTSLPQSDTAASGECADYRSSLAHHIIGAITPHTCKWRWLQLQSQHTGGYSGQIYKEYTRGAWGAVIGGDELFIMFRCNPPLNVVSSGPAQLLPARFTAEPCVSESVLTWIYKTALQTLVRHAVQNLILMCMLWFDRLVLHLLCIPLQDSQ